jgi:hypothetical protein
MTSFKVSGTPQEVMQIINSLIYQFGRKATLEEVCHAFGKEEVVFV